MNPELILKSELLDILFENRNKEYGAYELRNHYDQRLRKSLGVILSLVSLIVLACFWKNNLNNSRKNIQGIVLGDSLQLVPLNIPKDPPRIVTPPKRIATVPDTPPRIVVDNQVDHTTVPPVEELELKRIGTERIEGALPGDQPQGPVATTAGNGPASPEPAEEIENNKPIYKAEIMPEFPGGMAALQHFLGRNLKTPEDAMEAGSKVKVMVRFVVSKDGTVTGIEVEQSGGTVFDNEVLRVIRKMPSWKPGMQNGKNVAVYFKIPVVFQLEEGN